MKQIEERNNTIGFECVDNACVVVKTCLTHLVGAVGINTRPGDREAEGLEAKLLHHFDILGVFMIKVRRIVGIAPEILFRVDLKEMLADVLTLAALVATGFDLAS